MNYCSNPIYIFATIIVLLIFYSTDQFCRYSYVLSSQASCSLSPGSAVLAGQCSQTLQSSFPHRGSIGSRFGGCDGQATIRVVQLLSLQFLHSSEKRLGSLSCCKWPNQLLPRWKGIPLQYGVVFTMIEDALHTMQITHCPIVKAFPDHHVFTFMLHWLHCVRQSSIIFS